MILANKAVDFINKYLFPFAYWPYVCGILLLIIILAIIFFKKIKWPSFFPFKVVAWMGGLLHFLFFLGIFYSK